MALPQQLPAGFPQQRQYAPDIALIGLAAGNSGSAAVAVVGALTETQQIDHDDGPTVDGGLHEPLLGGIIGVDGFHVGCPVPGPVEGII